MCAAILVEHSIDKHPVAIGGPRVHFKFQNSLYFNIFQLEAFFFVAKL